MSKRPFDTEFWQGKYVRSLLPYEKLVYVYLTFHPYGNIAAVFDEQPDVWAFELKLPEETVVQIISRMEQEGKLIRVEGKVALTKWGKHQTKSPDVWAGFARVLGGLSGEGLVTLREGGYTLPQGCTWKNMENMIREQKTDSVSLDPPQTVIPPSGEGLVLNQTKPNQTTLGGGLGGLVRRSSAQPPAASDAGGDGGGRLELTEDQLDELDGEFPEVNIDEEYRRARESGTAVSEPMAFMRGRLRAIARARRRKEAA